VALDVSEYWAGIDAEDEADPWHERDLVDVGSGTEGW
jgi:hypothetical protein